MEKSWLYLFCKQVNSFSIWGAVIFMVLFAANSKFFFTPTTTKIVTSIQKTTNLNSCLQTDFDNYNDDDNSKNLQCPYLIKSSFQTKRFSENLYFRIKKIKLTKYIHYLNSDLPPPVFYKYFSILKNIYFSVSS